MTKASSHAENIRLIMESQGVRHRLVDGRIYVDSRWFSVDWLDITDWSIDRIIERLGY